MAKVQSVEPMVAELGNNWLKKAGVDYKLEQTSLNKEIDKALESYYSKNGGIGGNRPDAKLMLQGTLPVLIEYKGYQDRLVKTDVHGNIANMTSKNQPDFKHINGYAVNGAVHYANAILHHTSHKKVVAIGMTGHIDATGKLCHEIGVYLVSSDNMGVGQKVGEYTDLSFLNKRNVNAFLEKLETLHLSPEEQARIRETKEKEIDACLRRLNQSIYQEEQGLGENERVYLVAASIIATLGIPGKSGERNVVTPLDEKYLTSSTEHGNTDGEIVMRKIDAFLSHKNLPKGKREMISRTLGNTLLMENINKPLNGESQLKRVFTKIVNELGYYYKIGLTTDFTGKLFNEMYGWLGFSQDKLNDVVLTPASVATLLAKLTRINKDTYVWDFATGSAGLLVAAMNEMLDDAKARIHSPDELHKKEAEIKALQILGIELLPSVYMLAILNMIMMGDGSSNIINMDSLREFKGKYIHGKPGEPFPANAFVLNPPYSAEGNGMVFVRKALNMMNSGYGAVIIQGSAGNGKAVSINKDILRKHTLVASIKMPLDLFVGKSNVQTYIYVFEVNRPHEKGGIVKFIDFSNDGYTRSARKKASTNLLNTDRAHERYQEVADLVRYGAGKLNILTTEEYYEGEIDPESGKDWNQTKPVDTAPTLDDFTLSICDYLSWQVGNALKNEKNMGK